MKSCISLSDIFNCWTGIGSLSSITKLSELFRFYKITTPTNSTIRFSKNYGTYSGSNTIIIFLTPSFTLKVANGHAVKLILKYEHFTDIPSNTLSMGEKCTAFLKNVRLSPQVVTYQDTQKTWTLRIMLKI